LHLVGHIYKHLSNDARSHERENLRLSCRRPTVLHHDSTQSVKSAPILLLTYVTGTNADSQHGVHLVQTFTMLTTPEQ